MTFIMCLVRSNTVRPPLEIRPHIPEADARRERRDPTVWLGYATPIRSTTRFRTVLGSCALGSSRDVMKRSPQNIRHYLLHDG